MADQVTGLLSGWLRKKRISIALPHIEGKTLDFGCGVGQLADYIKPTCYLGVDTDKESISSARIRFRNHRFVLQLPSQGSYDTIVLLAVIEHLKESEELLFTLKNLLKDDGKLIFTTPHPDFNLLLEIGSTIGLFSKTATEEHEHLYDKQNMETLLSKCGLVIDAYQRFLFGANQIFIISKSDKQTYSK